MQPMLARWFSLCACAALLLLPGLAASAAGGPDLLTRYTAPLPAPENPLAGSALEERTTLKEGVAHGDATLAFSVRVPRAWSAKTPLSLPGRTAMTDHVPEEVARWEGPVVPGGRSVLTVKTAQLPYQMTAAQWLLYESLTNSFTLEGFAPEGDRAVQAAYITFQEGGAFAVRARAQVSGRHILVARYAVPVERREAEGAIQAATVNSFSLTNPAPGPTEAVKTHLLLDIGRFVYPASWRLSAPPVRSIDRMTATLHSLSADGSLAGEVQLVLLSRYAGKTLAEEVEALRVKTLAARSLALGGLISPGSEMPRAPGIQTQVVEAYAATAGQAQEGGRPLVPHEYWFAVGVSGDYLYIATLLTPAREQHYFAWARNVETYRFILSAFGPQEGARAAPPG
jgi:hypothetical protein